MKTWKNQNINLLYRWRFEIKEKKSLYCKHFLIKILIFPYIYQCKYTKISIKSLHPNANALTNSWFIKKLILKLIIWATKKIVILDIFGQKLISVFSNSGSFYKWIQTNFGEKNLTTKTFFFRHATTGFFKHKFVYFYWICFNKPT